MIVISPVLITGNIIRRKDPNALHPSIRAASSSDFGSLAKYGLRVITIKGTDPDAIAIAGALNEFNKPALEKVRNNGVNSKEGGIICVTRKINKMTDLPRIAKRAKPYAAVTPSTKDIDIEIDAIRKLLRSEARKSRLVSCSSQGSTVNLCG